MKDRLAYALYAALALGLVYRLWPLLSPTAPLDAFFITEDGYLMLTVARNLALGHGLSVSAGETLTNGVQPLSTFLYAIPYWLTGGDRLAGLAGATLIGAATAALAALALHRLARRMLAPIDPHPLWPLMAATLWFTGPLALRHTMNGLETGLNVLFVTLLVTHFTALAARPRWSARDQIAFGVLCGLAFLARNDNALLIAALFATRFLLTARAAPGRAVAEALPPGLISLAVAAPWLAYNHTLFGSIVPISGLSQSLGVVFAANAAAVPAPLFETMFPMLPIPRALESSAPVAAIALAATVLALSLYLRRAAAALPAIAAYAGFAVLIAAYYGLFFGAPAFLPRYFAPLAPLLIPAALGASLIVAPRLAPAGWTAAAALSAALLLFGPRPEQGHMQVLAWVRANVPEATWIGAVQTGVIGYWHDRTINLDGKVNPDALRARMREGDVFAYILASPIEYIADWNGVARWARSAKAGFADRFELIVDDPQANLAVLRRRN